MRTITWISSPMALHRYQHGSRISFHPDGREAWHQDTSSEADFRHRLDQHGDKPVYAVFGVSKDEISQRLMDFFPLRQSEIVNGKVETIRKVSRFNDALVIRIGDQEFSVRFDVAPY